MIENTIKSLQVELAAAQLRRLELQAAFNEAAELGDAPENFPLDAARAALLANEIKIEEMQIKLADLKSAEAIEIAEYTICDAEGNQIQLVIANTEVTVDTGVKLISPESPLGAALLQTKAPGTFAYTLPNGNVKQLTRVE